MLHDNTSTHVSIPSAIPCYTINFIPGISSKTKYRLRLTTTQLNKSYLCSLLSIKRSLDKFDKRGFYQISCRDCDAVYIGLSGKHIRARIKERLHSIINHC